GCGREDARWREGWQGDRWIAGPRRVSEQYPWTGLLSLGGGRSYKRWGVMSVILWATKRHLVPVAVEELGLYVSRFGRLGLSPMHSTSATIVPQAAPPLQSLALPTACLRPAYGLRAAYTAASSSPVVHQ